MVTFLSKGRRHVTISCPGNNYHGSPPHTHTHLATSCSGSCIHASLELVFEDVHLLFCRCPHIKMYLGFLGYDVWFSTTICYYSCGRSSCTNVKSSCIVRILMFYSSVKAMRKENPSHMQLQSVVQHLSRGSLCMQQTKTSPKTGWKEVSFNWRFEALPTMDPPSRSHLLPHTGNVVVCHHSCIQGIDTLPRESCSMTCLPTESHINPKTAQGKF